MPQMSGRQLVERLLPSRPELKVLYMSGYTDDAIVATVFSTAARRLSRNHSRPRPRPKVRELLDQKNRRKQSLAQRIFRADRCKAGETGSFFLALRHSC